MKLSRKSLMRKLKLVVVLVLMIGIGCISGCPSPRHDVEVLKKSCIWPQKGYMYSTAGEIHFRVDGELFVVPREFNTDLASIPRWYWPVLSPRYSSFVIPSIIHDYFYQCVDSKSRKFADEILYDALLSEGVSKYTATKFYWAVRMFGGKFYMKKGCNVEAERYEV